MLSSSSSLAAERVPEPRAGRVAARRALRLACRAQAARPVRWERAGGGESSAAGLQRRHWVPAPACRRLQCPWQADPALLSVQQQPWALQAARVPLSLPPPPPPAVVLRGVAAVLLTPSPSLLLLPGRRLCLMRHADSDPAGRGVRDHDRPITQLGAAEARQVAEQLRAAGWMPEVVVCSNAQRTRQTLDEMQRVRPAAGWLVWLGLWLASCVLRAEAGVGAGSGA